MNRLNFVFFLQLFLLSLATVSQGFKPSEVKNLSVNSEYAELGVKFYGNGKVIFASSKKNRTTKKRDRRSNRHMGLKLYTGGIKTDGSIYNVTSFSLVENNPILESNLTFTQDFKTIYFTRNNYIQDDYRKYFKKDQSDTHILKIYKASINDVGELSNITALPINSSSHSVTNPVLNNDGTKLYFSSNMWDSVGGYDIYELPINADGTYGTPKNLGRKVNSKKNEMFPFVSEDNILYFSSNGLGGMGELDVFKISIDEILTSKPENLGGLINSEADDFEFVFSNSLNIGYLTSTRQGSVGDADIYSFTNNIADEIVEDLVEDLVDEEAIEVDAKIANETIEKLPKQEIITANSLTLINDTASILNKKDSIVITKITDSISKQITNEKINLDSITHPAIALIKIKEPEECIQTVEGFILNKNNSTLDKARVTLYENGQNIGTYDLSSEGKYSFKLKCNKHYRVTARLNKFEESYFEIKTTRFAGTLTATNIILEKTPCNIFLTGEIKDINSAVPISGVKVYLIENNTQIDATQTNAKGNYTFTVPCDGNYKIATDKYGYEERIFDVDNSSIDKTTIILNNVLIPLECEQIVRGRVNNIENNDPIINAKVDLLNSEGVVIETAKSNSNGNFHFNIKCDELYKLSVSSEDFITAESNFKATDIPKQNHRLDFNLTPNVCLQTIAGNIINSRTKLAMPNINVNLMKQNIVVNTTSTLADGTFTFEVDCNSNYSVTATTKNYSIDSKTITTNHIHGNSTNISMILETQLDFELIRNQLMILTENIDFDLNQADIREDAAIELNKVVTIITRNPEIKVDIGVHTDSRAPDNFNLVLSEQRAQSILEFLVSRGINSNRLTGKGYGETQLLNECSNGVNCSESQHLINRRIEFVVTE